MSQAEFLCWIIGVGVVSGTIGAILHTYVEYIVTDIRAERAAKKLAGTISMALLIGLLLAFPGTKVSAQEAIPATPIVVNSTAPLSGSRILSTQFIGPVIEDCPYQQLFSTAEQAVDALTIGGKIFGLDLTPQQEKDLRWFLQFLTIDQSQDLWDLAPNVGAGLNGEEMILISQILSSHARLHADVEMLRAIFGIAFPPTPAPTWAGAAPTVTFIEVLD